jgi:SIR2-like protein
MKIAPPILHNLVASGECIAYVGAGFSMPSGMPDWHGLLSRIVDYVKQTEHTSGPHKTALQDARNLIRQGDLMMAASLLRTLISKSELNTVVERQFNLSVFHKSSALARNVINGRLNGLLSCNFAGIITTNYDTLLEYGIAKSTLQTFKQCSVDDEQLGDILCRSQFNQRFLVKLHGSITGGGFVLSTEEYGRVYFSNPRTRYFLIAAMLRHHLVFVGCSLEDELIRIRRELCESFSGNIPLAYALQSRTSRNEAKAKWLFEHCLIQTVFYEPTKGGQVLFRHTAVERFFEELTTNDEPASNRSVKLNGTLHQSIMQTEKSGRKSLVGETNRSLLKFIEERKGVLHSEFLDGSTSRRLPITLRPLSTEEIFYRVQYLISVELLEERLVDAGKTKYVLSLV